VVELEHREIGLGTIDAAAGLEHRADVSDVRARSDVGTEPGSAEGWTLQDPLRRAVRRR
jgi:hypothetical protein